MTTPMYYQCMTTVNVLPFLFMCICVFFISFEIGEHREGWALFWKILNASNSYFLMECSRWRYRPRVWSLESINILLFEKESEGNKSRAGLAFSGLSQSSSSQNHVSVSFWETCSVCNDPLFEQFWGKKKCTLSSVSTYVF